MLRGLCLVLMTIDHLPRNFLQPLTNQSLGFFSAAEGFVFISGMVSGWVFGRVLLQQGTAVTRRRIFGRIRDIYLTQLFLYTAILVSGLSSSMTGPPARSFWTNWWRGALLMERPSLFGILPMYCVFLLFTPLVLAQLAKTREWLVWMSSLTLWLAAQFGLGNPEGHLSWVQLGLFNLFAWQLLFVAGVYFGFRRRSSRQPWFSESRALFLVSVLVALLLFMIRHPGRIFGHSSLLDMDVALHSWKNIVHPLRLIDFAAVVVILSYLPRFLDEVLAAFWPFRLLSLLGRHSLQVFAWSVALHYAAFSFSGWDSLAPLMKTLLVIFATASLVVPAWFHACIQDFRKRRASQPPALLGANAACLQPD